MKIQPLTTYPIVKLKRIERNDQQQKKEDRHQKHPQKVGQEDEPCKQHIDERI